MRYTFLLFLIFLLGSKVFAFDIVYPKSKTVTINAKSTFFIGSSQKPIKINGQNVHLHNTGAFAYVVDLKEGKNIFTIESDDEKQVFSITKPIIEVGYNLLSIFIPYENVKYFYVTTENAPLRSTPVDGGINRLSHLQRNILLNIDGEKNGFYRVKLSDDDFAWISKSDVKLCENYVNKPAILIGMDYEENEEFYKYVFHLNKRVPFQIIEENSLKLKLYNLEEKENNIFDFSLTNINDKLYGYSGEYIENDFVWKIRKPIYSTNHRKPLKNITIAIDPGHGGNDFGAIGCLGDKEKDINLSISKFIETELKHLGANVIMTRDDDKYVSLKERVNIANYNDAQVLISIHANALPDGKDPYNHSGTSIYYYYKQAKPLAETIMNTVIENLDINNDKVRQASFALVRNTNALSILIETAYLINPEDNSKLVSEEFQKEYAKSIANSLVKYFCN